MTPNDATRESRESARRGQVAVTEVARVLSADVDHDEPGDPLGCGGCEGVSDDAAEGEAEYIDPLDGEVIEEGDGVRHVVTDLVRAGVVAVPVAALIEGDDTMREPVGDRSLLDEARLLEVPAQGQQHRGPVFAG